MQVDPAPMLCELEPKSRKNGDDSVELDDDAEAGEDIFQTA